PAAVPSPRHVCTTQPHARPGPCAVATPASALPPLAESGDVDSCLAINGRTGLNPAPRASIGLDMLMATMTASPDEAGSAADVDHALARASAGGDVAAFETLYRRHAARVHGVVVLRGRHH